MSEATSANAISIPTSTVADDYFRPSSVSKLPITDVGDSSSPSSSNAYVTQAFPFSSGNPRIEEIRAVMQLFLDDAVSSSSNLPVGRMPLICVLGVPNHMTYADFCQFCGSFIHHILDMRIIRNDGMENCYSILVRFDEQKSTDAFHKHFNGRRFSSLETESCRVLFTVDVQYTSSIEHAHTSAANTEQPSCPVCLERLDQDTSGILTTMCNHSFHCSCISKWTDSSCPVCRYCQQQPEKSKCMICQTSENVWICLLCGFVGCGRYKEGHAIEHWKETQHCYSLEVETQRVWDYVGDNYVHRLIQSKTDGKLVELNNYSERNDGDCPGFHEALLNSRVESIVNEYNELLTTQLENQKTYYESLLNEFEEQNERDISGAVKDSLKHNTKLQKMQAKLDKALKEKKFLDDINENLSRNKEIWEGIILKYQEREKEASRLKDQKIQELEAQLRDLMLSLEETNTEQSHRRDGDVLSLQMKSS
ncbi:BRAP2 RING ZnF UBP domain-containing protein 2-like [Rutidosis leptorrhynchoides]|uniref:BRAP2 RING ZnF UBP domain-containing protein 2-like n=1 Tax=Rutidosis leptorrhynchoides TaxID=125765 RepID=UPI003A9A2FC2